MVEQLQPIEAREQDPAGANVLPVEAAACIFCSKETPTTIVARGRDYEYGTSPDYFELVQCSSCELIFIQPRPAAEAMSTIYPSNYYAYNEEAGEHFFIKYFRDRVERVKVRRYESLVERDDAALLDIGCGDGRLLEVIRRFAPTAWQLAGIEIGEGAARRAAAKAFEVRTGDFESLDISGWEERFDLALMHHVIEHVRDPRAVLRKVSALMAEGGVFSVETPDLRGWDFDLFRERYWGGYHIPRHFYLFNADTLTKLLREEGFEILSVRSIPSPAFWIFSLHNYLVDRPWGGRLASYCHPQNILAVSVATALDALQLVARKQSTNLQVLARKSSRGAGR
jgi:2-polyprenyl-3-methyl-5-hydroxy-6-metoxy-1,4-benzoquinol methylase